MYISYICPHHQLFTFDMLITIKGNPELEVTGGRELGVDFLEGQIESFQ